jgi:sugar/nucleoside kinase (ribokinase family)
MTSASPSGGLDLVVVGGLTVDRFADGSSAPGGAVLHVTRALAGRGTRVGIVTTAGPEREAQAGLAELRALAGGVEVSSSAASITFGHAETAAGRELVLARRGGTVPLTFDTQAGAVLFAPISDEIPASALAAGRGAVRGAVLQGWLRGTAEGEPVGSRPVAAVDATLRGALGALDLVIGSSEDLRADGAAPLGQLQALRATLGGGPLLVVTDGSHGLWLDDGSGPRHLPAAHRVDDVSTIGAGDMFAAFMLLALAASAGTSPEAAAQSATQQVAEVLLSRRND